LEKYGGIVKVRTKLLSSVILGASMVLLAPLSASAVSITIGEGWGNRGGNQAAGHGSELGTNHAVFAQIDETPGELALRIFNEVSEMTGFAGVPASSNHTAPLAEITNVCQYAFDNAGGNPAWTQMIGVGIRYGTNRDLGEDGMWWLTTGTTSTLPTVDHNTVAGLTARLIDLAIEANPDNRFLRTAPIRYLAMSIASRWNNNVGPDTVDVYCLAINLADEMPAPPPPETPPAGEVEEDSREWWETQRFERTVFDRVGESRPAIYNMWVSPHNCPAEAPGRRVPVARRVTQWWQLASTIPEENLSLIPADIREALTAAAAADDAVTETTVGEIGQSNVECMNYGGILNVEELTTYGTIGTFTRQEQALYQIRRCTQTRTQPLVNDYDHPNMSDFPVTDADGNYVRDENNNIVTESRPNGTYPQIPGPWPDWDTIDPSCGSWSDVPASQFDSFVRETPAGRDGGRVYRGLQPISSPWDNPNLPYNTPIGNWVVLRNLTEVERSLGSPGTSGWFQILSVTCNIDGFNNLTPFPNGGSWTMLHSSDNPSYARVGMTPRRGYRPATLDVGAPGTSTAPGQRDFFMQICPHDMVCVPDPGLGSHPDLVSRNVRNDDFEPNTRYALYGLEHITPARPNGLPREEINNRDMVYFRDGLWRRVNPDIWYPVVTYGPFEYHGDNPRSTTISGTFQPSVGLEIVGFNGNNQSPAEVNGNSVTTPNSGPVFRRDSSAFNGRSERTFTENWPQHNQTLREEPAVPTVGWRNPAPDADGFIHSFEVRDVFANDGQHRMNIAWRYTADQIELPFRMPTRFAFVAGGGVNFRNYRPMERARRHDVLSVTCITHFGEPASTTPVFQPTRNWRYDAADPDPRWGGRSIQDILQERQSTIDNQSNILLSFVRGVAE